MKQKKILILGGNHSPLFIYQKAKSLRFYTICVDFLKNSPGHKIADKSYVISTTDKKKVLEISKKEKIDAIIPYASDPAALTASYVGKKLSLHHNPLQPEELHRRNSVAHGTSHHQHLRYIHSHHRYRRDWDERRKYKQPHHSLGLTLHVYWTSKQNHL